MSANANPGPLNAHDSAARHPQGAPVRGRPLRFWRIGLAGLPLLWSQALPAAPVTDSANRTHEITSDIKAVVPAGAPAQVLLHALLPDRLAGLVEPFKPDHVIYVDPKVAHLPQIPVLTQMKKPGDVAMVAELKPGLVVDYGNASPRYAETDEKIGKTLGVPAILFGGSLTDASRVAKIIGEAIGASGRAEAVSATLDDVLARVRPLEALGNEERVPVYVARGADGLSAARAGTSFDEPIRLAGGRNVVEAGNGTFKRMGVAEVVALKPAVVVFGDRDALRSPLHAALPKTTRIVLDTGEPYKVLTGPPSVNRLAGVAALAVILHPEKVKLEAVNAAQIEAKLFPIPPGLALPSPLQVQSR